tara:strand:- start:1117 stop:1389 length:273 start_codon:yes stop_codon:yes gene_type:complete
MFYISFSSYLFSDEIIDCDQFDKISVKYVECKTKNLKSNLNKKQTEMKSKVENIDETETGKKIKKSTLGQKLLKFKNSKTGSDFFKKNDN